MPQMDERQQLELAASTYFLQSYNARHRTNFQIVEHKDRPDFLVQDAQTGEKMGIEVMHLYFDAKEAQMVLGRRSNELHGVMTISELIAKLNADLAEKIARAAKYNFDGRTLLVIRVASPIFDRADFDMFEDEITVPTLNTFDEIWLLFWDDSSKTYSDLKQMQ